MYKSETILSFFFFLLLARLSSFSLFFSSFLLSFFFFWRRGDTVALADDSTSCGNDAMTQLTRRFWYPRNMWAHVQTSDVVGISILMKKKVGIFLLS